MIYPLNKIKITNTIIEKNKKINKKINKMKFCINKMKKWKKQEKFMTISV